MKQRKTNEQDSENSAVRLFGDEKRLLATPISSPDRSSMSSPGAEKKMRAYATMPAFALQPSNAGRAFIAFEDDDDEINAPVM